MNMYKISEKKEFSIEDIVAYSNIEITHVNDNKRSASQRRASTRAVWCWIVIGSMVIALFSL